MLDSKTAIEVIDILVEVCKGNSTLMDALRLVKTKYPNLKRCYLLDIAGKLGINQGSVDVSNYLIRNGGLFEIRRRQKLERERFELIERATETIREKRNKLPVVTALRYAMLLYPNLTREDFSIVADNLGINKATFGVQYAKAKKLKENPTPLKLQKGI